MDDQICFQCKFCKRKTSISVNVWLRYLRQGKKREFCDKSCQLSYIQTGQFKNEHGISWARSLEEARLREEAYWRERICKRFPVTTLKDMSEQKRAEMIELYEKPSRSR